ncbi:MAG TPA: hypothetical protein VLE47_00875 [Candidatus Saccharimonadales bacterium]|nr:hypothetical protein [Candidatus Saccharimonadales bacterium]
MKLLYALVCDQAFLSIDRKVNIIGVFETINAAAFPVNHPKFTLVGSIAPSKEKFKMAIDIVSDEGNTSILRDLQERDVVLPPNNEGKNFNFIIEILNTVFPKSGFYSVKILLDGEAVSILKLGLAQTEEVKKPN